VNHFLTVLAFHDHQITHGHPIFFPSAAALLELVNHSIEIGVAGAKASGEPVTTALHHFLAIGKHFKLAGLSLRNHGFYAQPLFNHGRETRDLGFVVSSSRTGTYLNVHFVLQMVNSGSALSV
jgi:hypothetical protein